MKKIPILVLLLCSRPLLAASMDPVVTSGIVNAPVNDVWKVLTTKEGIESWMVAKTEFELRVGATWKTSYSKDSTLDDDAAIHHTILAYDPAECFRSERLNTPRASLFRTRLPKPGQ